MIVKFQWKSDFLKGVEPPLCTNGRLEYLMQSICSFYFLVTLATKGPKALGYYPLVNPFHSSNALHSVIVPNLMTIGHFCAI